jgi:hypothetical protein
MRTKKKDKGCARGADDARKIKEGEAMKDGTGDDEASHEMTY